MTKIENTFVLLKCWCSVGFVFLFCVWFDGYKKMWFSEVTRGGKKRDKNIKDCGVFARHPIRLSPPFLCLTDRSEVALNAGCFSIIRQQNEILPFDTWRGIRPHGREAYFELQDDCVCVPVCVGVYDCGSYFLEL